VKALRARRLEELCSEGQPRHVIQPTNESSTSEASSAVNQHSEERYAVGGAEAVAGGGRCRPRAESANRLAGVGVLMLYLGLGSARSWGENRGSPAR